MKRQKKKKKIIQIVQTSEVGGGILPAVPLYSDSWDSSIVRIHWSVPAATWLQALSEQNVLNSPVWEKSIIRYTSLEWEWP